MGKRYMYLEEQVAENSIKYIRLIIDSNSVNYLDCTFENGEVSDFNERIAGPEIVDILINSPNIKGCSPVVFHGKTGIPMSVD